MISFIKYLLIENKNDKFNDLEKSIYSEFLTINTKINLPKQITDVLAKEYSSHPPVPGKYIVIDSGKPESMAGEPKTDAFIRVSPINNKNLLYDIKISYKKGNAEFVENKVKKERAEILLGKNAENILETACNKIFAVLNKKPLIYLNKNKFADAGSMTVGWRFDLLMADDKKIINNKYKLDLSLKDSAKLGILDGINLDDDKKNSKVNGKKIKNSGIANFILHESDLESAQNIIDKLISIDEYSKQIQIYGVLKAVNYKTLEKKYESRQLIAYIDWFINKDKKLSAEIKINPYFMNSGKIVKHINEILNQFNVKNIIELDKSNIDENLLNKII